MGWMYQRCTRKQLIAELTETVEWPLPNGKVVKRVCLAKTFKGAPWKGTLYAVFERKIDGKDADRYIMIFLLQYTNHQNDPMWGYKDMDEDSGPYSDGCPVKYFDMVPWYSRLFSGCGLSRKMSNGKWATTYEDKTNISEDHPTWQYAADFRARCRARLEERRKRRLAGVMLKEAKTC